MTQEVEAAVAEIRQMMGGHTVEVVDEKQGGAFVIVYDVDLGSAWLPSLSWIGFLIDFQYPRTDVYPHFIDALVTKRSGGEVGQGFSEPRQWNGRSARQVSRRTNRRSPGFDSAAVKLLKVIEWIRSR